MSVSNDVQTYNYDGDSYARDSARDREEGSLDVMISKEAPPHRRTGART